MRTARWVSFAVVGILSITILALSPGGVDTATAGNAVDLETVGQVGGWTGAVTIRSGIAYIGHGPRLLVADVSDPNSMLFLGETTPLDDLVGGVVLGGTHAFVKTYDGMAVVDVGNPRAPRRVAFLPIPESVADLAVAGGRAYALDYDGALRVIDVSDPTAPREIGTTGESKSDYLPAAVTVAGDFAFVVRNTRTKANERQPSLRVYDVAGDGAPRLVARRDFGVGDSVSDVVVSGSHAFIALDGDVLVVMDVADPTNPHEVGRMAVTAYASQLVTVPGAVLIVTDDELAAVDVSDPAHPALIATIETPSRLFDLTVWRDAAVATRGDGLDFIDVGDLRRMSIVNSVDLGGPFTAEGVVVSGDHAYVADDWRGLSIVDVSDPGSPREVGFLPLDLPAAAVAVADGVVYLVTGPTWIADDFLAARQVGGGHLVAINVADPSAPRLLADIETGGVAEDVAALDGAVYVADGLELRVFDVREPSRPTQVATLEIGDHGILGVDIDPGRRIAFVSTLRDVMLIVDARDPSDPALLARIDVGGPTTSVGITGNLAVVGRGGEGIAVVDTTDVMAPRVLGEVETPAYAQSVAAWGELAFVADGRGTLAIDLADPARPVVSSPIPCADDTRDVFTDGEDVFVASESGGLFVLRWVTHAAPTPGASETPTGAGSVGTIYLPHTLRGTPRHGSQASATSLLQNSAALERERLARI